MNAKQSKLLSSLPTATTDAKGKASIVPEFDSTVIDADTIKAVNDLVSASEKMARPCLFEWNPCPKTNL